MCSILTFGVSAFPPKKALQQKSYAVQGRIAWARRLATVKTKVREIVLRDVPAGESPYNLLQQVNAALAQSANPS